MLMSKRERHFAYAIIEKDIQDNTQLIEELKSEKLRDPDGPVLLLTVTDYTPVPRKLYIRTDEEFRRSENLPVEKWGCCFGACEGSRQGFRSFDNTTRNKGASVVGYVSI